MTPPTCLRPWVVALCAGLCIAAAGDALAQDATPATLVATAQRLVEQLSLDNTSYEHGQGTVTWSGVPSSRTDCSGFIDHLLMHVDGYTREDFKHWFGSHRPTAARYHDAIAAGSGFTRLRSAAELHAGDLIAIKYLARTDNTGHIMLVAEPPRLMSPVPPFVNGATQWAVTVIDSSESGHGPTDTRHKRGDGGRDHDGLGRGVFRLYAGPHGEVVGFAWSTSKASRFVEPQEEDLVLGRLLPGFRP